MTWFFSIRDPSQAVSLQVRGGNRDAGFIVSGGNRAAGFIVHLSLESELKRLRFMMRFHVMISETVEGVKNSSHIFLQMYR